jgi:hypothetical protein
MQAGSAKTQASEDAETAKQPPSPNIHPVFDPTRPFLPLIKYLIFNGSVY